MAFLDKWMLTNVNACYIELFHIQKELTCIRLQGIIETTKAKKEKKRKRTLLSMLYDKIEDKSHLVHSHQLSKRL